MALTSHGALDELHISDFGHTQTAAFTRFDTSADLIFIAVKATSLAAAAAAATATTVIGADTMIVPMLNGVPWWFVDGMQLRSVDQTGASPLPFPWSRSSAAWCTPRAAGRRAEPWQSNMPTS